MKRQTHVLENVSYSYQHTQIIADIAYHTVSIAMDHHLKIEKFPPAQCDNDEVNSHINFV